jgi:hypothetical protein
VAADILDKAAAAERRAMSLEYVLAQTLGSAGQD